MRANIPQDNRACAYTIGSAGRGLDVRKMRPLLRRGKCFFLTSPFIEPRSCGPAASAHAALVAPTSASAQTNYGQNQYRVRSKVGTDSDQNEYRNWT